MEYQDRTILIVDDEGIVASAESLHLRSEGYKTLTAFTGETAVSIVREHDAEIDLVLMDIDLGSGMDGTQAAQEILRIRDIPILFLSSHTEKEIVSRTEKITSYGYVVKDSGDVVLMASIKMAFKLHDAHTRLQQQEIDLRENEEKYRAIVENTTDHIMRYDNSGRHLYANPAALKFVRTGLADIVGKNHRELGYPEEVCAFLEKKIGSVFSTGESQRLEFEMAGENGRRHLEMSLCPEFSRVGSVKSVIGISRDITEEQQAAEILHRQDLMLRLFIEHAPAAIAMFDNTMKYISASRRWLTDYGLGERNIIGVSHYEIFPEITDRWKEIHRRCLAGAVEKCDEDPFPRADGSLDWVRWEIRPWYESPTVIGGILIFSEVITESKRNREALQKGEERFERLITHAPIPFSFSNERNEITFVNRRFTATFGYATSDIPTLEDWWRLAYPGDANREEVKRIWFEAVEKAKRESSDVHPIEFLVRCKNGEMRNVLISGIALDDVFLASFIDITERKRAEVSMQQLLGQKQILMRELQHRVKNSLNIVSSLLGFDLPHVRDEQARQTLMDARGRIRSMAKIYDQLNMKETSANVDLGSYLGDLAKTVIKTFALERQNIRLHAELPPLELDTDRTVLVGLILNELMTNSLKYAFGDAAEGEITVRLAAEQDQYRLCVSDNGIGLKPAKNREASGSQGMNLIQMLVQQLDGSLTTHVDGGTRVCLAFHRQ